MLEVAKLAKRGKIPLKIFITIEACQHLYARNMLKSIEKSGLQDYFENLGYIPPKNIATIYQKADMFVLPTLLESFGLTYLEAMQHECPIITSDREFSRYICGSAALYFDPYDPNDILDKILKVANNSELENQLIAKGKEILVSLFKDWDEVAKDYIDLIESI